MIREHRELLAALEAGDVERAVRAIGVHVRGSGNHVIDRMGGDPMRLRA